MTSRNLRTGVIAAALACAITFGPTAAAQGMFGPGKFKVEQTDDRFSTSPTTMTIGRNNRVTKKSPVGGIYIGSQGFYLDPVVVKSRGDGKVVQVGFAAENRTELDTTYGSPNSLGSLQE